MIQLGLGAFLPDTKPDILPISYLRNKQYIRYTPTVKVERGNVPLSYTEFLIQPFGPSGLSQLLNYDIIEFPEEGNPNSSNQIEFPSLKSGRGQMVSTPEQETLQEKLQTTIKGTFPLFTLTLRFDSFLLKFAFSNHFGNFSLPIVLLNRSNLIFREDFFPGSVAGNAPVAHSRNWLYHRDLTEDLACFDEAERHFMLYVYSTYTGVLT